MSGVAAQVSEVDKVRLAFEKAKTETEFLTTLKAVLQHPKAPDFLFPAFQDFFNNYKSEFLASSPAQRLASGAFHAVLARLTTSTHKVCHILQLRCWEAE